MAYKSYGSSRGFRPIKAGQEALNQQLVADEKVIRDMKTVRDQTVKRDDDLIQGLRRKFNLEDANRESNQRLEDKAYQQRLSAIQKNAQRTRQNSEIDIANVKKEAEVWKNFSETAVTTLTAYAEHRQKQIEIEDFNTAFQNPDLLKTESMLGEAVWKKMLTSNATIASQAQAVGENATTVTTLATLTPPVKSVGKAKAIIALNINNYDDYLESALAKAGATSYADVKKIAAQAPFKFAQELGVHKHGKLLVDYFKVAANDNDDKLTKVRIAENYQLGEENINEALQNWELYGKGGDDSQTWLDLVSYAVKNSYDEKGKAYGNIGMKEQLGVIAANPRHIKNRAEFDAFLGLKTLPNTDADGNITNPSISIRQLYGEAGVGDLWNEWVTNKDKDRKRDEDLEKIHQNDLFQAGKKAILTESKGDPKALAKIYREVEVAGGDKNTIAKLTEITVGNDANTAIEDRRSHARVQVIEGDFYEDDYNSLPSVLQQDEEFKNAYVQNDALLKKVGITSGDLKTNAIQFIIKDILQEQISTTNNYSATNNLAWQAYRNDVIAEYRFNVTDKSMGYGEAYREAVDTVNDLVKKGEGKWRRETADKVFKEGGDIAEAENKFVYFDTDDRKNYGIPYPTESTKANITNNGKEWLKTNQVITRNELRKAIEEANDGYAWKPSDDFKAIAKHAGIPLSELANQQIKLLGLPDTNLFEPSLTEKAVLDVKKFGNYKLTNFAKDINNIQDFVKVRAAATNPRNPAAMSQTTRWNLSAYDFGNNTPVEKFLTRETLNTFPAGQAVLTKYTRPSGGWTGGAREINRRIVEGGNTKVTIRLPGNNPDEPHYLFLLEPGGAE
tara:strand:+ start:927 stop:3461 length:2535 start_codon:yes stop_codon:yes gene_type:complete